MEANYHKYLLDFIIPGGTSRGVLRQKETYFLVINSGANWGVGECGLFRGLSCDDRPDYEEKLAWVCTHIHWDLEKLLQELKEFPSIQFGLEQAFLSFKAKNKFELFPSEFSHGKAMIPINGLIWMGDKDFMKDQITAKLEAGFATLKMKIGAIDFKTELNLLEGIRKQFNSSELELRVDANGAFTELDALIKLKELAAFDIHSIEQPVKTGQWELMAELCKVSPLPIALDEELIGIRDQEMKRNLLKVIKPQFIILKPSLVGGFNGSREWITLAEELGIGWWITSALESNIGLNAIAQFCFTLGNSMPQGLGTGDLFSNNINSPLSVGDGALQYDPKQKWSNLTDFLTE
ncbi:MAG: o-succinylbenzoate synthase [Flavobacteriales bacterium]|nr:o-succinylbenzoate synthase [Flavobacteriales bacterium]